MTRNRFSALTTAGSIVAELNIKGYQVDLSAANTIDVSVFFNGEEEDNETFAILSKYCLDSDELVTKSSNNIFWHTIYISFVD